MLFFFSELNKYIHDSWIISDFKKLKLNEEL